MQIAIVTNQPVNPAVPCAPALIARREHRVIRGCGRHRRGLIGFGDLLSHLFNFGFRISKRFVAVLHLDARD